MINGDLNAFLDDLFLGEELEVLFRGRHFFIQGYTKDIGEACERPHLEMFEIGNNSQGCIWERDGDGLTMAQLASEFLKAKIWDGMNFSQAEREIEWIG